MCGIGLFRNAAYSRIGGSPGRGVLRGRTAACAMRAAYACYNITTWHYRQQHILRGSRTPAVRTGRLHAVAAGIIWDPTMSLRCHAFVRFFTCPPVLYAALGFLPALLPRLRRTGAVPPAPFRRFFADAERGRASYRALRRLPLQVAITTLRRHHVSRLSPVRSAVLFLNIHHVARCFTRLAAPHAHTASMAGLSSCGGRHLRTSYVSSRFRGWAAAFGARPCEMRRKQAGGMTVAALFPFSFLTTRHETLPSTYMLLPLCFAVAD